ncbi:mucosal pentraxin-like [Tenrec ecaudatus]|uniref:mucosal pentraxin-like n=1 Tax=Tenrec ecaudatus TaxID=94439 RepID=UPI003F5A4E2F
MGRLLLGVLFFLVLTEGTTHSDLGGKVFIFPQESNTAYVSLIPKIKEPLKSFTLCMKGFTDLTRPYSLFSYNTPSQDNELLLFVDRMGEYGLYLGNAGAIFMGPPTSFGPIHLCVSWESVSGIAELWVNGKPLGRKGVRKGYTLGAEAKIILGQEQDSYGGGFDAKQSFVGEIWDVSLWDYVLPLNNMCDSFHGGNVIDWQDLNYVDGGYVVIKSKIWL